MSPTAVSSKQVTVLGGLGFIGSHICRALIFGGYKVRVFDRPNTSRLLIKDIESDVEIVRGDMAHTPDVLEAVADTDVIIHLVHTTVPGSSMRDPVFDVDSNVVASVAWLRRLSETNAKRILYFSSGGTVYGVAQYNPMDEDHPVEPISSYGITKLAIEKYVQMYATLSNIDYIIVRPSNIYGVGQKLHIGQGVIGVLAQRALSGEALEIWGDGNVIRDYLYIEDAVSAIINLMNYNGSYHLFNLSSGLGYSVLDVISILCKQLPQSLQVTHLPERGFDVPVSILSSARLHVETGWQPRVDLAGGIQRTLEWLKSLHLGEDQHY